ncbi:hypothetical protein BJX99DRAFT_241144 [Aspergillus californicus]
MILVRLGWVGDDPRDEAKERAGEILKELGRFFAGGEVLDIRFGSVVGKKAF